MTVAAVERTLTVLEALAGEPAPLELSELAARTGLPASATHRTLSTLLARGWVVQDADSQCYALSLRMPMLAFRNLDMRVIPSVLQSALDRLAESTCEYCRLALVEAGTLTWVARAQGARRGLRYDPDMGAEIVLHATANGKAWLSTLPDDEALALARPGFAKSGETGPNCVRSLDALRAHLSEARTRGFATSIEEAELGTAAVAVPVRGGTDADDPIVGTISVAGPALRITNERIEPLARALRATANEIAQLWPLHLRQRTRVSIGKAAAE